MTFRYSALFCLIALMLLSGCFPSTVSVAPDGRIALPRGDGIYLMDLASGRSSRLYEAEPGKEPSWVQWSPKGDEIMYAVKNEVFLVSPDGTNLRSFHKTQSTMGLCLWSPDKSCISVAELGMMSTETEESQEKDSREEKVDPSLKGEQLPCLTVLDVKTGKVRWQVQNTFFIHRWMPDSKSIIVYHILKKDKESGIYTGEIASLQLSDGKLRPMVSTMGFDSWLDVSPSAESVYFTAHTASLSKEALKVPDKNASGRLFRLVMKGGKTELRDIGTAAIFFTSPDSKRLLIARQTDEGTRLVVCDENGDKEKLITQNPAINTAEMSSGKILPLWLNNDEIMFWRYVTVLAPDGKSLTAFIAKADGSKVTNVQWSIEQAIIQASKKK